VFSTLASLLRMAHVGFVLAREGALALVDPAAVPPGPAAWGLKAARLIERRDAGSSAKRLAAARLGVWDPATSSSASFWRHGLISSA
jgi:ubiquinone biosynthesis protein